MPDIANLIQQSSANLWLFIPSAILLGALHGLEPGHSKTMMAAFIIAVRGTVFQAVLLGLAATVSHTAIVWAIALLGLHFGSEYNTETIEPYLQLISGVIIVMVALWMILRTWHETHHHHHHHHTHSYHQHDPQKHLSANNLLDQGSMDAMDEHERQHAREIHQHFGNRIVTKGQIILFGLTGGLIPCPASVTVLLICLQLKQITMGVMLVLCFSIGLAVTMVGVGTAAALSLHHVSRSWTGFDVIAKRAPYLSSVLITIVGLYTADLGYQGLFH